MDDEDDLLCCLNRLLTERIISRLFVSKKSVKFIKFDDLQDSKMHIRKFQEEAITYVHDKDTIAKLFSSSLRDDALKLYFSLP